MKKTLTALGPLRGRLRVPGDKSISHRALIFGAMASGAQRVRGLSNGADVASTMACLRSLGCNVEARDGAVTVGDLREPGGGTLDAGNSGTTARLMCGLLAGLPGEYGIDGDTSLRARPMERVVAPLRKMGAVIETSGGRMPLRITGGRLSGITYELPVASAQVKSAILIAGLRAQGDTTVIEPVPTRDQTERMFEGMGVGVRRNGRAVTVTGTATLTATDIDVPGDISSAVFFAAAAAAIEGSDIRVEGVGVNPTRTGFIDILRSAGAAVSLEEQREVCGEPVATLRVTGGPLRAVHVEDPGTVATAIDELPLFAVLATQAHGTSVVSGAGELRHKESDRIDAIVDGLRKMGADIEARQDGFVVNGPTALTGAAVSSRGDHRIAMALGVAAMLATGETGIDGADSIAISYPEFFNDLQQLTRRVTEL